MWSNGKQMSLQVLVCSQGWNLLDRDVRVWILLSHTLGFKIPQYFSLHICPDVPSGPCCCSSVCHSFAPLLCSSLSLFLCSHSEAFVSSMARSIPTFPPRLQLSLDKVLHPGCSCVCVNGWMWLVSCCVEALTQRPEKCPYRDSALPLRDDTQDSTSSPPAGYNTHTPETESSEGKSKLNKNKVNQIEIDKPDQTAFLYEENTPWCSEKKHVLIFSCI